MIEFSIFKDNEGIPFKKNKDFLYSNTGVLFIKNSSNYSNKEINYLKEKLNKKVTSTRDIVYKKTLIVPWDFLLDYFEITDKCMLSLIEYDEIKIEKVMKNTPLNLSNSDIKSLLKPVFKRYKHLKKKDGNLRKVKYSIENHQSKYDELVLYNCKFQIEDSHLVIMDNLKINLEELIYSNNKYELYECVSLGKLKELDKVILKLEPTTNALEYYLFVEIYI